MEQTTICARKAMDAMVYACDFLDSTACHKHSVTVLFLGSPGYNWVLPPPKEYLVPPLTVSKMFPLKVLDPNDSIILKCLLSDFRKDHFQLHPMYVT